MRIQTQICQDSRIHAFSHWQFPIPSNTPLLNFLLILVGLDFFPWEAGSYTCLKCSLGKGRRCGGNLPHKTDRQMDEWRGGGRGEAGREGDVRTFILCEDSRILIFENQHSLGH